jgi:CRP-like cAMP-binding protein
MTPSTVFPSPTAGAPSYPDLGTRKPRGSRDALGRVRLSEIEPDLFGQLGPALSDLSSQLLVAPVHALSRGAVDLTTADANIVLLVIDGLLARSFTFAGRSTIELLGPGDVLISGGPADPWANMTSCARLKALTATEVAVIDDHLWSALGRFPKLPAMLAARMLCRVDELSKRLAATQVRDLEARLLIMLWQLADRWGRATTDGVRLNLPLSHATLAALTSAQRPSVTTALGRLRRSGRIERIGRYEWRLLGQPPTFDTDTSADASWLVAA